MRAVRIYTSIQCSLHPSCNAAIEWNSFILLLVRKNDSIAKWNVSLPIISDWNFSLDMVLVVVAFVLVKIFDFCLHSIFNWRLSLKFNHWRSYEYINFEIIPKQRPNLFRKHRNFRIVFLQWYFCTHDKFRLTSSTVAWIEYCTFSPESSTEVSSQNIIIMIAY